MGRIYVITGSKVTHPVEGTYGWGFMFKSKAPFEQFGAISSTFGMLFDSDVWQLRVFRTSGEPVFGEWRSDEDDLLSLIIKAHAKVGDFVLLMPKATYEQLAPSLELAGITIQAHHFDGVLSTS